jgi:hypothetical protein
MLHFLTTENGRENLNVIAQLIVRLRYQVPKSRIMKLAKDASIKENGKQSPFVKSDEAFFWTPILSDLGIPYRTFTKDGSGPKENYGLSELSQLLQGKKAEAGMPVYWRGRMYVLCFLSYHTGEPSVGDTLDMNNVEQICLAPNDRIDINA